MNGKKRRHGAQTLDDVMILRTWAFKSSLKWTPRPPEEGWASDEDIEHSHPAGQGTANSQPRETLERETILGLSPLQNFRILLLSAVNVTCLQRTPMVWHVSYERVILFYSTTSFQNTDIRKNMVVTFPHHPGGSIFPQESKCQDSMTPLACKCLVSDLLSTNFWITSPQTNILQAEKVLWRDIFPQ